MTTEATPARRLTWAPYSTRLYSSRPCKSVPMTWAEDGGSRRCARPPSSGPYGARIGANIAATTKSGDEDTAPRSAGLLRSRRRAASPHSPRLTRGGRRPDAIGIAGGGHLGVPDPRIEDGVQDVDQEIHHEEDEGEDQDRVLDHEVVAVDDAIHDVAADAAPGEDRLGDDRAREQAADLQAEDRSPPAARRCA